MINFIISKSNIYSFIIKCLNLSIIKNLRDLRIKDGYNFIFYKKNITY